MTIGISRDPSQPGRIGPRTRAIAGYLGFALLVYGPLMLMQPGQVAADTKSYLYLDPGRLLSRVGTLWDPNIGLGTVSHQSIGYLFPLGPFYWVMEHVVGAPDWVSQRIWLGTLLFGAGLGMRYLLRTFDVRGPGVPVAMLAFALSPYALEFSSRLSVLLGPWAALPWLLAFMVRALRVGGWKYPALFALTVQLVGGVNATALLYALIGPAVWFPYVIWVRRETTLRQAWSVAWRTALLTLATSLWWISGLFIEGRYGLGILRFTESVEVVSATSTATEILRGLGYWFFYGGDRGGPWNDAVLDFSRREALILVSFLIPAISLACAAVIRWRDRAFFVMITLLGMVIAVAASPYDDPTVLGSLFKAFATSSTAGFALRSTARAVPLISLGFSVLLGVGISAVWGILDRRGRGWVGLGAATVVGALCIVNAPGLWNGRYYSKYLERDEAVPGYWTEALQALDARGDATRVLAVPGADFAAYRWGDTIDPIEPGLMDRPYVARELVPWGGEASTNLLIAVDRRLQDRLLEPNAIAPIARLMGVGDVLLRNDLVTDQFNLVSARGIWSDLTRWGNPAGLDQPTTYGTKIPGSLLAKDLGDPTEPPQSDPAPVVVFPVQDPVPIVRARSAADPLIVDGDGEGLVDAAAAGLLDGRRLVLQSPSFESTPTKLRSVTTPGAALIVTDSNRRRGMRWAGMRDNYGYTETAGEQSLRTDLLDQRLEVFPDSTDRSKTVVELRGLRSVRATTYGTPAFGFAPEGRPTQAIDGDPKTAWEVAAGIPTVGRERIEVVLDDPVTSDHLTLLQANQGPRGRWITKVGLRFDDGPTVTRDLDLSSRSGLGQELSFPKRSFSKVGITIEGTVANQVGKVASEKGRRRVTGVGFAEIGLQDDAAARPVRAVEVERLPTDLLHTLGESSATHPLAIVMTPTFADFRRRFVLPTTRSFALEGEARLNANARDDAIDGVLGIPGADAGGITVTSTERYGSAAARGSQAFDGDPSTAWTSRARDLVGEAITVRVPAPITVDRFDLQLRDDGRHSMPTRLRVTTPAGETRTVDVPTGTTVGGVRSAPVTFPALTSNQFRVTLDAVAPLRVRGANGAPITLPVGIAEMGIPGVRRPALAEQMPDQCIEDQLLIDGRPVGVRVDGSTADAVRGRALPLRPCDPGTGIDLSEGSHLVRGRTKRADGLSFGRMTLTSSADGRAVPVSEFAAPTDAPTSTPRVRVLAQDRTSMRLRVDGATSPYWLVLGQSLNPGWRATVNGRDLGAPQLVDGFANGWQVPASDGPVTISLEWTPQRYVATALWISALGVLACMAIIAGSARRRRRRRAGAAPDALDQSTADELVVGSRLPGIHARVVNVFRLGGTPPTWPVTAVVAVGATVVTAIIVRPALGVVVGALVLAALRWPRLRGAVRLAPAVLTVLIGVYVATGQLRHNYPPQFRWPNAFEAARNVSWLVVILFAAEVVIGRVVGARSAPTTPSTPGSADAVAEESPRD